MASFIGIVDFSEEARWLYMTESVTDLLGFEPHELIGRPSLELVHPDEFTRVKKLHTDTIEADKAAALVYLRMKHKDPYKGYILCGVSRTVVHNVLVGSVSFATPDKAMQNASTAQEITVIAPEAADFHFRRWNDPSPLPPSPVMTPITLDLASSDSSETALEGEDEDEENVIRPSSSGSLLSSSSSSSSILSSSFSTPTPAPMNIPAHIATPRKIKHLSTKSFRTAFILDRFTLAATILYCSNSLFVSTNSAIGRSFFDFVKKEEEPRVRGWVELVKRWGVATSSTGGGGGHTGPSDGGFGFGRFGLLAGGRDRGAGFESYGRGGVGGDRGEGRDRGDRGGSGGPERGGGARERSRRTRTLSGVLRHTHHTSGYGYGRLTSPPSSPYPLPYAHSHHLHHQRHQHHASSHSRSHPSSNPSSYNHSHNNAYKEDSEHGTLALDPSEEFQVDAIFSAHSDGIIVIVRRAPSV